MIVDLSKGSLQTKKEAIYGFVTHLRQEIEDVGHNIKLEETWVSSVLTCYNRKYFYKGVPCASGIKQAIRSFTGSNDDLQLFDSMINSETATGQTLASNSQDPTMSYIYYLMDLFLILT